MKYLILLLNVLSFWLMADAAHAEPISLAITSIAGFFSSIGAIGKLVLTVAINIGLSLVEKALAKKDKPQPAGTKLEISMGDDHAMSFIIGSYATAGKRKYAGTWGEDGKTPNAYFTDVIEIGNLPNRAGERGLTSVWIDDQKVGVLWDQPHPDGRGFPVQQYRANNKDYLWIKFLDGTQTNADPYLMAKFGTHAERPWKPTMIGRGCQIVILTSRYNTELFRGVPAGLFEPHPLPLYDIRKDSSVGGNGGHRWADPSTWEPSINPAVMTYNLARGVYYGSEWVYGGQNIGAFCLPATNWMAAANACDASVPLDGGGSEPAFRAGYDIQCDQEPLDAISELLKGCNGRIAEVGGIFKMLVGTPGAAVYSFTDNDIIVTEEQDFQPFPSLSATYNAIEATYPEPAEKWATKNAPGRYNTDLEAQDGNRRLPAQVQLLAVPFANQVQRIGLAMIQDYRRFRVHQVSLPPDAYPLEPNDVVSWSSARNGYDEKKFLVVKVEPQPNFLIVVTLKEVDPADYDWHPGLQLPTAVGWLGPITPPSQPMIGWTVEPSTIKDAGGIDRRPAIKISCAPELDDVAGVWVQVRLKETGDVVFDSDSNPYAAPYSWLISGQWTLANTSYEVRGRYLPQSSRATDWSAWLAVKTPNVLIQTADVLDGAIVQSKIADAAISAAKIMDEAVSNLKLADHAVSTAKLEIAAVTADVLASGAVISAKLADGAVTARALAQGAVDATSLASGIKAVEVVSALPTTGNDEGRQVYLTTDGKLYRYHNGAWTAAIAAVDVNGTLNSSQIADNAITSGKLAPFAVDASKLADGSVSAAKLAANAVDATKFASGIRPVEIVSSLPATGNIEGRTVYLTADDKLYRYTGSTWTAATPASDITGQMTDAQIAAVNAAKVTGTLVSSQIADAAITNQKLAALAVDAAKLADNAITTTKIADNAISTPKLQANAITADKIAANAVTAKSLLLMDFENLVQNGKFEDSASSISSYLLVVGLNTTMAYVPSDNTGALMLQMVKTTTGSNSEVRTTAFIPVTAGEVLYFETSFKSGTAEISTYGAYYRLMWFDASKVLITPNYTDLASSKAFGTTWTDYTGKITVPAGARFAQVRFFNTSTTALTLLIDRAIIRRANAASLIVDGSITTNHLAAGSVTTAALAAGSVTADDIAANAVISAKIAAGSVSADKIAANSITAGQIAAGAIGATQIAAKAITVDKLLVGSFDNMIDLGFSTGDISAWLTPGKVSYYIEAATTPLQGTWILQADGRGQALIANPLIRVSPSESYNFTAWFYNTDPDANAYIGFWQKDQSGNNVAPGFVTVASSSAKVWTQMQANFTVPAGVYYIQPTLAVDKDAANGKLCYWGKPNMRRASGAELIVDGAVTASKVAANAITADKVAANAITADKMVLADFTNRCENPNFGEGDKSWVNGAGVAILNNSANAYTGNYYMNIGAGAVANAIASRNNNIFPVLPGEQYFLQAFVKATGTPAGLLSVRIRFMGADKINYLNQAGFSVPVTVGTSYMEWNATVVVPAGVVYAWVDFVPGENLTVAGSYQIGFVSCQRKNGGNLIVDGAITAAKIGANAVTAGKLAANAVTAGTIAANAVTAGMIAAGAVSAAQIAADAITAEKLASNSVTTDALAVGSGKNLLQNTSFTMGLDCWGVTYTSGTIPGLAMRIRQAGEAWAGRNNPVLELRQGSGPSGFYADIRWKRPDGGGLANSLPFSVLCAPGEWLEATAYISAHRCSVELRIEWVGADGGALSYTAASTNAGNASDQNNPDLWPRLRTAGAAPANAVAASFHLRKLDTISGQTDSFMFVNKPMLCRIPASATEPTPWSDGGVVMITNGGIVASAVTADKIAANAITAGKIAANAVTAGTIAAGAVTATTIAGGTITGDKLAANTIGAGQIAADSITAKQLVLTDFSNMADNGWQTGTLDGWTVQNQQAFYLDTTSGDAAGWVLQSLGRDCARSNFITVTVGEVYAFDVWVYNTDSNAASIYAALQTPSGTWGFTAVTGTTVKNGWVRLQGRYAVPSGYTKLSMLLQVERTAGTGGSCYWSKPVMRRAVSAELIVDGAITANKIAVNSLDAITANLGAVNISSAIIGTLQVGTSNIQGGAVTAVSAGRNGAGQTIGAGQTVNLAACGITVAGDGRVVISAMTLGQFNQNGGSQNSQPIGCNIFRDGTAIFSQTYYLGVVQTVVSGTGGQNGGTSQTTYTAGLVAVPALYDAPGAGYHSYTLQIYCPGNTIVWNESNIIATAFKR